MRYLASLWLVLHLLSIMCSWLWIVDWLILFRMFIIILHRPLVTILTYRVPYQISRYPIHWFPYWLTAYPNECVCIDSLDDILAYRIYIGTPVTLMIYMYPNPIKWYPSDLLFTYRLALCIFFMYGLENKQENLSSEVAN